MKIESVNLKANKKKYMNVIKIQVQYNLKNKINNQKDIINKLYSIMTITII